MNTVDFYIEQKPEHYYGADISITIKTKPSARIFADHLRMLLEDIIREEAKQ